MDELNMGQLIYDSKFKKATDKPKTQTAHKTLVDRIIEVAGEHPRYNKGFWYGRISGSKLSPQQILDLCDDADKMDDKYNKGGFINNNL